ncbi:hypothetical protein IQ22_04754 [Pseudomonas duriflava]|uniref:Uncharacterized protein n=1 Tax=Pseudomonas duriflava TaxID=459528 RepID=A0A562PI71_9PSED|nr:hypothetical protein IQ22_04754 [Pseudomonas duriflava]
MWSGAATSAGMFVGLLYHFAIFGQWRIGLIWPVFLLLSAFLSFILYRRAWLSNERIFLNRVRA